MKPLCKASTLALFVVAILSTYLRAQAAPAPVPSSAPAPAVPPTAAPATAAPAAVPTAADDANNKELQNEGQTLIDMALDDLASDDPAAQQRGQKQLIGLGDAALPSLEKYLQKNRNPAVKQRAQSVMDELESHFTFEPTLITIHMANEAPKKIFEELTKQSGIPIDGRYVWDARYGNNNVPKKITVDFEKKPFWEALLDLADKAKVSVQNNGQGRKLQLYQGGNSQYQGPRYFAGPVTFVANNINRSISLGGDGKNTKSLTMQVMAYSDPKLHAFEASTYIRLTEAAGDQGTSLIPKDQDRNNGSTSGGNDMQTWLQVQLPYDTAANTKLTTLKGTARFRVASETDKLEVPDVMNAKGKTIEGKKWKLTVKDVKQNGNSKNYVIDITGSRDVDPAQRNRGYSYSERGSFHLYDANGLEYDYHGGGGSWGDGKIEQQIHFGVNDSSDKIGPPAKFVWDATLSTRFIRVPVEFKDIPIPRPE
jgi:hypothetical protein